MRTARAVQNSGRKGAMKSLISYKSKKQMSESFLTAAFLSVSGGLQDAYTYISRGHVFANAQTGNIVLLSQLVCQGELRAVLHYLVPVIFFALGVAAAELIHQAYRNAQKIHWRQLVLIIEVVLLFLVGFLPATWNSLANAMVSFACAMQVQAFRKVNSYAFASTMCIGNLRSGMESLCAYHQTHNKRILYKAMHYFGVIFLFALGAGLGSRLILAWGLKSIWASCLLLLVSFSLMFIKEKIEDNPELQKEEQTIKNDLHEIRKEMAEIFHTLEEGDDATPAPKEKDKRKDT